MLKLGRVTKVKVLFRVLVFVFNFTYSNVFEFSAAILEKGLLNGLVLSLRLFEGGTETVSCPLSLRIARMEMDWNLKNLANFFKV